MKTIKRERNRSGASSRGIDNKNKRVNCAVLVKLKCKMDQQYLTLILTALIATLSMVMSREHKRRESELFANWKNQIPSTQFATIKKTRKLYIDEYASKAPEIENDDTTNYPATENLEEQMYIQPTRYKLVDVLSTGTSHRMEEVPKKSETVTENQPGELFLKKMLMKFYDTLAQHIGIEEETRKFLIKNKSKLVRNNSVVAEITKIINFFKRLLLNTSNTETSSGAKEKHEKTTSSNLVSNCSVMIIKCFDENITNVVVKELTANLIGITKIEGTPYVKHSENIVEQLLTKNTKTRITNENSSSGFITSTRETIKSKAADNSSAIKTYFSTDSSRNQKATEKPTHVIESAYRSAPSNEVANNPEVKRTTTITTTTSGPLNIAKQNEFTDNSTEKSTVTALTQNKLSENTKGFNDSLKKNEKISPTETTSIHENKTSEIVYLTEIKLESSPAPEKENSNLRIKTNGSTSAAELPKLNNKTHAESESVIAEYITEKSTKNLTDNFKTNFTLNYDLKFITNNHATLLNKSIHNDQLNIITNEAEQTKNPAETNSKQSKRQGTNKLQRYYFTRDNLTNIGSTTYISESIDSTEMVNLNFKSTEFSTKSSEIYNTETARKTKQTIRHTTESSKQVTVDLDKPFNKIVEAISNIVKVRKDGKEWEKITSKYYPKEIYSEYPIREFEETNFDYDNDFSVDDDNVNSDVKTNVGQNVTNLVGRKKKYNIKSSRIKSSKDLDVIEVNRREDLDFDDSNNGLEIIKNY